ncbi:MAG: hypothetical protein COU10_00185 [Candidatus Harrisonbacteria bacterium CG10_big_fil_rev_8_21_14_0_10_45_28]|uniref:EamA domain-containing protein n=1 Tax=Candidatus Harrisonbacteria bacterium CG10_big_fil_rev_8_21_14_0_10_45_28 TaxID=1974586 RepID=A0A2H0UR64_9BACT|nr:MAG: hypothetical protein COU10_00185 [Candidatus Harrisonbacteria bacterium CG10_big_fil_rev_8_21_14_0_10_45_28]
MAIYGVLAAVAAMVGWGLSDFLFQRVAREVGIWEVLFGLTFVGTLVLFPFVYPMLLAGFEYPLMIGLILVGICLVRVISIYMGGLAILKGKLSVVEPVISLEMPMIVLLSIFLLGEKITGLETVLIILIFLTIILAVTERFEVLKYHQRVFLESGALIAFGAAFFYAIAGFLIGYSSRHVEPVFVVWLYQVAIAGFALFRIVVKKRVPNLIRGLRSFPVFIIASGLTGATAWVMYGFSAQYLPISLAIALSQGYVLVAGGLGVVVNKEKIAPHQVAGILLSFLGIIALGVVASLTN